MKKKKLDIRFWFKKKQLILQAVKMFFERLIIMTRCPAKQNALILFSYGKETKSPPSQGGTYVLE